MHHSKHCLHVCIQDGNLDLDQQNVPSLFLLGLPVWHHRHLLSLQAVQGKVPCSFQIFAIPSQILNSSSLAATDPPAQFLNCLYFICTFHLWSFNRHVFQFVMFFCRSVMYFYCKLIIDYLSYVSLYVVCLSLQVCICSICFWIGERRSEVTAPTCHHFFRHILYKKKCDFILRLFV